MIELYGYLDNNLEEAKSALEKIIGVTLSAHESTYMGGNYYVLQDGMLKTILLRNNIDLLEEDAAEEPNFSDYPIILYVQSETFGALLKADNSGFTLLRTEKAT